MDKQKTVDDWNSEYPPGTTVTVALDVPEPSFGNIAKTLTTTTRSHAALLGGHTPVVWLNGLRACYSLERVTPAAGR